MSTKRETMTVKGPPDNSAMPLQTGSGACPSCEQLKGDTSPIGQKDSMRRELYQLEYNTLREEMLHMRNWRLTFLMLVISVTGILLAVNFSVVPETYRCFLCLLPLFILFPSLNTRTQRIHVFFADNAICNAQKVAAAFSIQYIVCLRGLAFLL